MRTNLSLPRSRFGGFTLVAFIALVPALATAQGADPSPRPFEVKGVLGFSTFIDEDFIEHVVAGASMRLGLSGRWSIEPQFLYMRANDRDQDFYLLGNLVFDLDTRGRVTPYWIVGGGIFWHRSRFGLSRPPQTFTARNWHVGGGGGVRIRIGRRWALSSEARLGLEPFFQVNAGLGYAF